MWGIIESKIVFHVVHVRPVGPATVAGLLCPNVVSEAIVEDLRRTLEFISFASTDAVVGVGVVVGVGCVDRRKGRRRNFVHSFLISFLFFAVRKDDPVRRIREDNPRLSA